MDVQRIVAGSGEPEDVSISRVSSFAEAGQDAVVFAATREALLEAQASAAALILVSARARHGAETSGEPGASELKQPDRRILRVDDARLAFAQVAHALRPELVSFIDPRAVLADGVVVGSRVRIATGCVIAEDVVIGNDCVLHPNVTLYPGVRLGDRVVVHAGAVLGAPGFGYARDPKTGSYLLFPQQGTVEIGDDVEIGANSTIDRGALGPTTIGRGTKIDNLVHVGHNCTIGEDVILAAQTGISGSSVIEDGAVLGGQVGVGEHATVGRGVILGGGAGVLSGKKMHGPGQVFWGRPARPLKEYLRDLARLKRR
jgi:UDP-3-O-[3-hydroxymyristoyl] glucosamine N-acyltransferase